MKRWQFWEDDLCPRCLTANENTDHVLRCADPRAAQARETAIGKFRDTLLAMKTETTLQAAIIAQTKGWLQHLPVIAHTFPLEIRRAMHSQGKLGWDQFLRGRIVKEWQPIQEKELQRLKSKRTSLTWVANLVQAIWDMSWTLWDHRNDVLHNSDMHDQLLDMETTDMRILEEWTVGTQGLHRLDKVQFRGITIEELLEKPSHLRRRWLQYVDNARAAAFEQENPANLENPLN